MALVCSTYPVASVFKNTFQNAQRVLRSQRAVAISQKSDDGTQTKTLGLRLRSSSRPGPQLRTHSSRSRRDVSCPVSLKWLANSNGEYEIDEVEEAKRKANRLVSTRLYTRHALERRLEAQGYSWESIDLALTDIQESGKQSDLEYAETFARYKWRTSKWSPNRIRMALQQKGVSVDDINEGVGAVFGDDVFGCPDEESEDDIEESPDWMGQLRVAARKHWRTTELQSPEVRRRRMVQWLMRRGHSWDVVRDLVDELEDESRRLEECNGPWDI